MNESERLADQIHRALHGNAWHGPSWKEALEGVNREAALHRPIREAHTIGEIVMHAATWHDVVRRRIGGENPDVPDADDWPPGTVTDEAKWSATVARLFETEDALVATVRRFPPGRLQEKRPNVDDTWFGLIIGELQHVLYHAGQVSLLKKAVVRVTV